MQGKNPDARLKCSLAAPVAALCLAVFLGPLTAAAQTSSDTRRESNQERAHEAAEKRKRESAEKHAHTQAQQHEAAEKRKREVEERRLRPQAQDASQKAIERERQAAERRDREKWERQEIVRRQNAMRDADNERAKIRSRQNADWEKDMQRQRDAARQGAQPAAPGTTCSANPFCPASGGYGNACMGVRRTYSGAGAAQTGLRDIVSRCRAANAPDLCSTDLRLSFGGGCAQQCANVATCAATAAR